MNQYVENLVAADVAEADVVEPCSGQWSSPILLVPKKDGSLRAVADLRKVNKCVVADSYAMPDTQELLDLQLIFLWHEVGRWYVRCVRFTSKHRDYF